MADREIESLFYGDLKDKSSMVRSSRVSSRTTNALKKYGLNPKHKKDKKEKTVLEINMNKYIPWVKFKELPEDLQEQYLQNIVDKYQVWAGGLAKLWATETSRETVRILMNKLNIVRSLPEGVSTKKENIRKLLEDFEKTENLEFDLYGRHEKPTKKVKSTAKSVVKTSETPKTTEITEVSDTVNKLTYTDALGICGEIEFEFDTYKNVSDQILSFLLLMKCDSNTRVKVSVSSNNGKVSE